MNYDHCSTAYEQLVDAWGMLMDTGAVSGGYLRPEAYTSWIRCNHKNIFAPSAMLSKDELTRKMEINRSLLANSRHVVNGIDISLHRIVGSNYAIILMDEQGLIMDILYKGNKDIPVGDRTLELSACSNAIDISSNENTVLEVYGYEHVYPKAADWHTIGHPIYNYDKTVAGGLGIVCETNNVSSIVPVVKMGSQLIQSSLIIEQTAKNRIGVLLEEIPEAVIAINEYGVILNANHQFSNLLNIPIDKIKGQNFTRFIRGDFDYDKLTSYFGEFSLDTHVIIQGKGKIYNFSKLRKSIVGSLNNHPLILLLFKNTVIKSAALPKTTQSDTLYCFDDLIGESEQMTAVKKLAQKAAGVSSNVLITGESGTGKELMAQSIHSASRPNGPFVAVNCGAFARELLQSELFGYEEGAFTGARKHGKPGKFELANGGTLFLDEIGEMPIDMQVSLLRCLQEKAITRVGGTQTISINVRIIAATNRDLYEQVKNGKFREDLYYRLNVLEIHMPPLRERAEDIPGLCQQISSKLSHELCITETVQISAKAMECLTGYNWPGNVRELQNVLERAIVCSDDAVIDIDCLPSEIRRNTSQAASNVCSLKDYEKIAILKAIQKNNGNIRKSAEELGIARSTLYQKMDKLGIPHEQSY